VVRTKFHTFHLVHFHPRPSSDFPSVWFKEQTVFTTELLKSMVFNVKITHLSIQKCLCFAFTIKARPTWFSVAQASLITKQKKKRPTMFGGNACCHRCTLSKHCWFILSSQMFSPESSSQFSTETAHWDFYTCAWTITIFGSGEILTCWARAAENKVGLA